MNDSIMAALNKINDGWTPVTVGLPPVGEQVCVTTEPKRGERGWNKAYVDEKGFWHGNGTHAKVVAWKRIIPWKG